MKTYIIQIRTTHDGRLIYIGRFAAESSTHAIADAAKSLADAGEDVVQIVATVQEG
jgi:hypothetical protein